MVNEPLTIFFFEDEQDVANKVKGFLELPPAKQDQPGLVVDHHANVREASEAIDRCVAPPDAALLDVEQPDFTGAGFYLCEKIKAKWPVVPVIFLSNHDSVREQIRGYEAQASVYLSKASLNEPNYEDQLRTVLLAQIRNVQGIMEYEPGAYRTGSLEVDTGAGRVYWRGREVGLSASEISIVHALARPQHEGRLCRYDDLAAAAGMSAIGANQIRINVRKRIQQIRKAFERVDEGFRAAWAGRRHGIVSVARVGYRWVPDDDANLS